MAASTQDTGRDEQNTWLMTQLSLKDIKSIYYTFGMSGPCDDIPNLLFKRRIGWHIEGTQQSDNQIIVSVSENCHQSTHDINKRVCIRCRDSFVHNEALARFDEDHQICPVCRVETSTGGSPVIVCSRCGSISYVCWGNLVTYVTMRFNIGGTSEDTV